MSILPKDWIPFSDAVDFIEKHTLESGNSFILEEWDCKYINARIDMRTGMVRLSPGNVLEETNNG